MFAFPRFRSCPDGYLCLPNIGDNPNFGYTSFDNLLWAMLTTFQLITLDFWENVYNMVNTTQIKKTAFKMMMCPS